ncbi:hypothetical protein WME73_04195 [Sorangium sp. So ce302]|uniref:hypothetical protein n=1 Tax=Sorangium sp. So ce302 TaxID=3133297 RepID=UPI003F5ECF69
MATSKAIVDAIDTLYLDRKGLIGTPGFDAASKAWDLLKKGNEEYHVTIWAFAMQAERADRAAWGTFRALIDAWLLEQTKGTFSFPNV